MLRNRGRLKQEINGKIHQPRAASKDTDWEKTKARAKQWLSSRRGKDGGGGVVTTDTTDIKEIT